MLERVLVVVEPSQFEIRDDWRVNGMEGTGSKDAWFDQLTVDLEMACGFPSLLDGRFDTGAQIESYLDVVPLLPYLACGVLGPILGCAEGAFQDSVSLLRTRRDSPFSMGPSGRMLMQERLAIASSELAAAQQLFEQIIQTLHLAGLSHQPLATDTAYRLGRDRAYLVHLCKSAAERLVRELKTSALFETHPVQRRWQDIQAMASHIDVNWDKAMTDFGAHLLG